MKSTKKFNKIYTTIGALASISMLMSLLIVVRDLNIQSIILFALLIVVFLGGLIYSLGYLGGKKEGYGFSNFINIVTLLAVFLVMLSEVEVYLYLNGFKVMVTVVIVQVFLIIVVSGVLMVMLSKHIPQHNS